MTTSSRLYRETSPLFSDEYTQNLCQHLVKLAQHDPVIKASYALYEKNMISFEVMCLQCIILLHQQKEEFMALFTAFNEKYGSSPGDIC